MKRVTMKAFIRANREALDAAIYRVLAPHRPRLNDRDRAQWIANDESLYQWARESGVRV
jgi:hypothetical protein